MTNEEKQQQMVILNERLAFLHDYIKETINECDDQQLNNELLKIAMDVTKAKMTYCDVYVMAGVYND